MDNSVKKVIKDEALDIIPPSIEQGSHPVLANKYLIDTLEINAVKDKILGWANQKLPGAIIYGDTRLGKTRCIEYVEKLIQYDLKDQFQVFRYNCQKFNNKPSEDNFFKFFLRDVGHLLYESGTASAKRDRLFKYLLSEGKMSTRKHILLFLDDAQRLNNIEYEWLMDIFNELDRYGITLTSILIGQLELKHRRDSFIFSDMRQIVGRFMTHEYNFRGIKDISSLEYLLAGFDYSTEYPESSNWCYTRYFFPKGFAFGNRLENFTEQLWGLFINLNEKAGIRKPLEIPMHHIIVMVNMIFRKYGYHGEGLEWPNMNHWKESIQESGYLIFQGINYGQPKGN
jgi:hypothetical protein